MLTYAAAATFLASWQFYLQWCLDITFLYRNLTISLFIYSRCTLCIAQSTIFSILEIVFFLFWIDRIQPFIHLGCDSFILFHFAWKCAICNARELLCLATLFTFIGSNLVIYAERILFFRFPVQCHISIKTLSMVANGWNQTSRIWMLVSINNCSIKFWVI